MYAMSKHTQRFHLEPRMYEMRSVQIKKTEYYLITLAITQITLEFATKYFLQAAGDLFCLLCRHSSLLCLLVFYTIVIHKNVQNIYLNSNNKPISWI